MFAAIARAVFGTANDRSLKAYQRRVPQINALEPAMAALSDEALRAKTVEFRERLQSPEAREAFTAFFERRQPDFSRFE